MELNNRARFVRLFNGEPLDRAPFLDIMGVWESAIQRCKTEGLDREATRKTAFNMVRFDGARGYKLPINGCPSASELAYTIR